MLRVQSYAWQQGADSSANHRAYQIGLYRLGAGVDFNTVIHGASVSRWSASHAPPYKTACAST